MVLRLPDGPGGWSVREALLAAPVLTGVTAADLELRSRTGELVDADGRPVDLDAPVLRPVPVYLYRDPPREPPVPFDMPILHLDDDLVVVDKPHFLATMPRGAHVAQTALVRLRRELGSDDVAPAHRLDRLTAGVLLFTRRREVRAAYQELFAQRRVRKEYRAIAPADDALAGGVRIENRIVKTAGDLRARVVEGEVNAISDIELSTRLGDGLAEYRLAPHTGRTHQLRMHMAQLGVPIVGDPLYPEVDADLAAAPDRGDFSRPLRLVAAALEFTDPFSGERREFRTAR
ncbi:MULTISPECIES: pseudouridine synthase [Gordonia]|uniref:RNA pseudouridylate synthase n=2 Tax=Gordonia TaxID=2053 RepID=L7LPP0_9ACTN|nr:MULTISPECIES: pseudouridine synthase [Gordonia]AUH67701.1 pseudouridine synthase [Gordonia sp. YC-JH1]KJR05031.1 pseudouridine synthase [Gordonia sihwensis]KXT58173.1 pseudouridine synthase [Gordonia sp. QH-12]MBY4568828.1 pseudouridine synthase [Gordonia sihwensis]GAC62003.1 putative pseudouridine synthase [Gordonia sihwensis NBRC 108236]